MPINKEYEALLLRYNRLKSLRRRDRQHLKRNSELFDSIAEKLCRNDELIRNLEQLVAIYSPIGDLDSIETLN